MAKRVRKPGMTLILPYPIAQQVSGVTIPGHKLEPRALKDWTFAVSSAVLADPHHAPWLEHLNDLDDRTINSSEFGAGVGAPPSGLINPVLPGTFTHSDVADLSFRVMMQARAPRGEEIREGWMTISIEAGGFGRLARLTRTNDTNGYNAGDAVGAASGAGGRFQHDSLAVALPAAVPAATRTPSSVGDWIVFSFALKS